MTNKPTPEGETSASQPSSALHRFDVTGRCIDCDTHESYNGARLTCPNAPRPKPSPARSDRMEAERPVKIGYRKAYVNGVEAYLEGERTECNHRPDTESYYWFHRGFDDTRKLFAASTPPASDAQERALKAVTVNLGLAEMTCEQLKARLEQANEHILRLEAERAPSGEEIKPWQERIVDGMFRDPNTPGYALTGASAALGARDAEIADLRAALARRATAGTTAPALTDSAIIGAFADEEVSCTIPQALCIGRAIEAKVVAGTTAAPSSDDLNFGKLRIANQVIIRQAEEIEKLRATAGNAAPTDLTTAECPTCKGEGWVFSQGRHGPTIGCDDCDGQGRLIVSRKDMDDLATSAAAPGDLPPLPNARRFVHGYSESDMREYGRACIASNAGAAPACRHCDGHGSYEHKGSVVDCRVCGGTGTLAAPSETSPVGATQEKE
jgi:hypothetical protein